MFNLFEKLLCLVSGHWWIYSPWYSERICATCKVTQRRNSTGEWENVDD